MHFEHEDRDFWSDESTRPLRRVAVAVPVRGSRSHTGAVPVVPVRQTTGGRLPSRARLADGRVDPFWTRLGMLFGGFALLVPVALIVRSTDDAPSTGSVVASTAVTGAPSSSGRDASSAAPTSAPSTAASVAAATAATTEAPATDAAATTAVATKATTAARAGTRSTSSGGGGASAAAATPTIPTTVSCTNTYTVVAADYWLAIAYKTGSKIKELLAANNATADSMLYPGRTICLPAGASSPTTAAPTTARPATTAAAITAASSSSKPAATTAAPSTAVATTAVAATAPRPTAAPTTTVPPRTYTRDEIIQIIRDVWPDDQEDKAIAVATRESSLIPTAQNYCCYGLFQIYYTVHRMWLNAMGISSAEMLYDPVLNTKASYQLYLRAGGWGPWGG